MPAPEEVHRNQEQTNERQIQPAFDNDIPDRDDRRRRRQQQQVPKPAERSERKLTPVSPRKVTDSHQTNERRHLAVIKEASGNLVRVVAVLSDGKNEQTDIRPDHSELREEVLIPGKFLNAKPRSLRGGKNSPDGNQTNCAAD